MGAEARRAFASERGGVIGAGDFFLNDNGIGACGQRRPGEDADSLAGLQRAGPAAASGGFADNCPWPGQVGPADGIAVHCRGIEWRLGERSDDRRSEDATAGVG